MTYIPLGYDPSPLLFRPKGIRIFWRRMRGPLRGIEVDCSIRSRGRTGATSRQALMSMNKERRRWYLLRYIGAAA